MMVVVVMVEVVRVVVSDGDENDGDDGGGGNADVWVEGSRYGMERGYRRVGIRIPIT